MPFHEKEFLELYRKWNRYVHVCVSRIFKSGVKDIEQNIWAEFWISRDRNISSKKLLDAIISHVIARGVRDIIRMRKIRIAERAYSERPEISDNADARLLLREIADRLSVSDGRIFRRIAAGYFHSDIADEEHTTRSAITKRVGRIRRLISSEFRGIEGFRME